MTQNNGGKVDALKTFDDDAPVDEIDEQLVAYLDGELESDQRSELETRLGRDSTLRARLRTLQNGWDLLDELPMATPSSLLLESTLRMAATESAALASGEGKRSVGGFFRSRAFWLPALAILCFGIGAGAVRFQEHVRFRTELKQLPVAMHINAYLHATDLELMRSLMAMPQWQKTVAIAERFGEWDFRLQSEIDAASPTERQQLLRDLPIEDQQVVVDAWQQFEQLAGAERSNLLATAARVADQSDSGELLATMDRFARWRESLAPAVRDQIASGDDPTRMRLLDESLQRTVKQWTQQTARLLTKEDIETIYQALRHIARLRIMSIDLEGTQIPAGLLRTFGSKDQLMEPRMEAFFLSRMFDPNDPFAGLASPPPPPTSPSDTAAPDAKPTGDDTTGDDAGGDKSTGGPAAIRDAEKAQSSENGPGRGAGPGAAGGRRPGTPPAGFDFFSPALGALRPILEQLRGPLREDELGMVASVLGEETTAFLEAAAGIEMLQEELLRTWADEAIRRTAFSRSGRTVNERYELLDPARRDQLDLMPPDQILESLRYDRFGGNQ